MSVGAVIGDLKLEEPNEARRELGRSGLVLGEPFGEIEGEIGLRSIGGRGERGTFHKLASSGRSSSKSSYSASISLIDFRLGCHEPLLIGKFLTFDEGAKPGLLGDAGPRIGLEGDKVFGDGDLERFRLLIAVIANDGVEGLLKPLLIGGPNPFDRLSD